MVDGFILIIVDMRFLYQLTFIFLSRLLKTKHFYVIDMFNHFTLILPYFITKLSIHLFYHSIYSLHCK